VKQAGVVPVVDPAEDLDETFINAGAVEEILELAVGLDPPVLADPKKMIRSTVSVTAVFNSRWLRAGFRSAMVRARRSRQDSISLRKAY
jgi:hypothetical protein